MSEPRVWHVNDPEKPADAVYVGRAVPRAGIGASPWGNPFGPWNSDDPLGDFERYAAARRERDPWWLAPLAGKHLACWCKGYTSPRTGRRSPDRRCHGDILLALAARTVIGPLLGGSLSVRIRVDASGRVGSPGDAAPAVQPSERGGRREGRGDGPGERVARAREGAGGGE